MNTCPSCGAAQPVGARFCSSCGAAIPASGAAPGQPLPGTGAPAPQPKTSGTAIAALILSIIPICLGLFGLVLGIVALVQINKRPNELKGKGLAIAAICIPAVWFVVGILAAIAIPNFIRYTQRAKQGEVRVNLKALYVADQSYRAEHPNEPASSLNELGFAPGPRRHYAYFYGQQELQPDMGGPYELGAAERARLPEDTVAAAASNLDSDPTLDLWTVDSQGELHHVVDDLNE